jgi:hypothetical protein
MLQVIQKKRLTIAVFALAVNEQFKYPSYFQIQPFGPNRKDAAEVFFEAAITMDPKQQSVALVGTDAESSRNALDGARANAKRLGLNIVHDNVFPLGTVNLVPVARPLWRRHLTSPARVPRRNVEGAGTSSFAVSNGWRRKRRLRRSGQLAMMRVPGRASVRCRLGDAKTDMRPANKRGTSNQRYASERHRRRRMIVDRDKKADLTVLKILRNGGYIKDLCSVPYFGARVAVE